MTLEDSIKNLVKNHINVLGINSVTGLRQMTLELIEPIMIEAVMKHSQYNQSDAARKLGVSRFQCRIMLVKYFGAQYCKQKKQELEHLFSDKPD
jgi:DNA-binding protein Fis